MAAEQLFLSLEIGFVAPSVAMALHLAHDEFDARHPPQKRSQPPRTILVPLGPDALNLGQIRSSARASVAIRKWPVQNQSFVSRHLG